MIIADIYEYGPVVQRELLAQRMIALRHEQGLTQEQVRKALSCSVAKVKRLELGLQRFEIRDVESLLKLYDVPDQASRELIGLSVGARKRGWWSQEKLKQAMSPDQRKFVGLEVGADRILHLHALAIPDIIQTDEYAQWYAVEWEMPHKREALLEIRARRQSGLANRASPARQVFVLDEGVIRKPIGPPGMMARQLRHLADISDGRTMDVRVIQDKQGSHIGMKVQSFVILEFDNGLDRIFFSPVGEYSILKDQSETMRYSKKFEELVENVALGGEETKELLRSYADQRA